ncbi:hypothetical protein [uncultured Ruminococcus sp.]|uniref:hypothetical protein n=1 Tax=uncultured Ruminococcus sp. TaxID=165186 RepID=UPI00262342FB|nr:hypothetical protein [uncultured Ruminococcus sp.]
MYIYEGANLIGSVKQYSGVPQQYIITYNASEKTPDDVRGYLVYNGNWNFYKMNQYTPPDDYKKLALILESPHTDEYSINGVIQRTPNGLLIPQRPANGFAGDQIDKFIQNRPWVNSLRNISDVFEVYIMNAIQYQCSAFDYIQGMTKLISPLRDAIFLEMWNNTKTGTTQFQSDLVDRIMKYSPNVIINACTKGTRTPTLQMRVEGLIQTMASGFYDIDDHPANPGKYRWK